MIQIPPVAPRDKLSQIVGRINPMLVNQTNTANTVEDLAAAIGDLDPENIPDFTLIFDNHLL